MQLGGATTCQWHQFFPTLTVPKSDLLPVPSFFLILLMRSKMRRVKFGSPGVFLASCAGIDGTSEEAVDGTNPESMFQ